ncbi:hypothetical protein C8R43DRAFT_1035456, partial [Mycena crocata]
AAEVGTVAGRRKRHHERDFMAKFAFGEEPRKGGSAGMTTTPATSVANASAAERKNCARQVYLTHLDSCVTSPPNTMPRAAPSGPPAEKAAKAAARARFCLDVCAVVKEEESEGGVGGPGGNAARTAAGIIAAPPTPCNPLNTASTTAPCPLAPPPPNRPFGESCTNPHPSVITLNTTPPNTNTLLRPRRRRRAPEERAVVAWAWRADPIVGRAMAMEVLFAFWVSAVHVAAIATARSVLVLPCSCARSPLSESSGSRARGGADRPIPISVVFRCRWATPAMSAMAFGTRSSQIQARLRSWNRALS